jgi:transcriptional regulator with XRE-family HTH domain
MIFSVFSVLIFFTYLRGSQNMRTAKNMENISIREFARRVGTSDMTIRKYLKKGKIPESAIVLDENQKPSGLFFEEALEAWKKYNSYTPLVEQEEKPLPKIIKAAKQHAGTAVSLSERIVHAKERKAQQLKDAGHPEQTEMDMEKMEVLEAERREKSAKAQLAEINLEERIGKLVNKAEVEKSLFTFGIEIRDNIMSIGDRVIDLIRAADDRQEALNILNIELNKALYALSQPRQLTKPSK